MARATASTPRFSRRSTAGFETGFLSRSCRPPVFAQLPADWQLAAEPLQAHYVYMSAAHGPALLRSPAPVDAVAVLRQLVRQRHADLDGGAASWLHGPRPTNGWSSPVRLYVHALCIEDITVQSMLREVAPLFTWLWPDLSGPPDAAALGQYARAVYASTDVYLVKLPADGLSRVVDLTKLGLGRHAVAWVMRRFVVTELARIYGVISGATAPSSAANVAHQPLRSPRGRRRLNR